MNRLAGIIVAVIGLLIAILSVLKVVPGLTQTGVVMMLLGGLIIGLSFVEKPESDETPRMPTAETPNDREHLIDAEPRPDQVGTRTFRPLMGAKSRRLRVTSVSRCSRAVAAMSASGSRTRLERRIRPARSATAVSTGRSVIAAKSERTLCSSGAFPEKSSARVTADTWRSLPPRTKRR